MDNAVKKFIEHNIDLIERNNWVDIYKSAERDLLDRTKIGEFTSTMFEIGCRPEYYLHEIPNYFLYESLIETFNIPNHITSIGTCAFYKCKNIADITIPDNVTDIGVSAFAYNDSIKTLSIGDNVTEIKHGAFSDCCHLTDLNIGVNLEYIGLGAFRNCYRLNNVVLPNNVKVLDDKAFYGCHNLTHVTLENTLINIGEEAFGWGCGCDLNIKYDGTKNQWKNIAKGKFKNVTYICTCIDGVVKKLR